MSKLLLTTAAAGVLAVVAFSPAAAETQRTDGLRNAGVEQLEVSDHRRRYRRYYSSRRYYGPGPYYSRGYYAPYYAYSPRYYRPYYRPAPFGGVGPFGW